MEALAVFGLELMTLLPLLAVFILSIPKMWKRDALLAALKANRKLFFRVLLFSACAITFYLYLNKAGDWGWGGGVFTPYVMEEGRYVAADFNAVIRPLLKYLGLPLLIGTGALVWSYCWAGAWKRWVFGGLLCVNLYYILTRFGAAIRYHAFEGLSYGQNMLHCVYLCLPTLLPLAVLTALSFRRTVSTQRL
ncbi:MAG: hypothetical protein FWF10_03050 [Clostridiales bacterium]|nr:hypothetical protein [Clostridiales bacterium]